MPPPPPPDPRHVPSSAISAFIAPERLDALLAPWVPNGEDRAFVVRCLVGEGPAHHRGANFVLLALLGELLERTGGTHCVPPVESVPVGMRLPPHMTREAEEAHFPLRLPTGVLERLAPSGSRELAAMVDCLTDGPPQHALANTAMVCLLSVLFERLERGAR